MTLCMPRVRKPRHAEGAARFVGLLWHVLNRLTPFNDEHELFDKHNYAYLLQRLGLCAAQVIAMLAVVPDFDTAHPWWSSVWLLVEGLYVMVAIAVV